MVFCGYIDFITLSFLTVHTQICRKAELNSWDIITSMRPAFVPRRVFYGSMVFITHVFLTVFTYRDTPPSVIAPILVTILYPAALAIFTRVMTARTRPAARYVFEFLLAFDLFQLLTSCVIFCLVVREAMRLVRCLSVLVMCVCGPAGS